MTIKTAGDLRSFLAGVLGDLRNGTIDAEQATAISKISAQITNSLAVEVKAAIELQGMGKDRVKAGEMMLTSAGATAGIMIPVEDGGGIWCDQCDMRVSPDDAATCKSAHCKAK